MQPARDLRRPDGRVETAAMPPCENGQRLHFSLTLADPAATEALARRMAPELRAGDVVGLVGGLGAGKSLFARALIGARLEALERAEEIPSPSFTLVQTYDLGGVEIWHADLYRLGGAGELAELGLEEAFAAAICLVEWADRLGPALPARRLMLAFDFVAGDDAARELRVEAAGNGWDWLPAVVAGARE